MSQCDLLVCGGGSSGIATAVAAARHGLEVVLLERWAILGGMSTAALVNCFHRCDREKIVINGLVRETVDRLDAGDWIKLKVEDPNVHETEWFDPEGMKVVWQQMLRDAGVRTICHLPAGRPLIEGTRITGVVVETKVGTKVILADYVVDATGDGDIAAKAGCSFDYGRADGRVQGMTMMYQMANIDDKARRQVAPEERAEIKSRMRALCEEGKLPPCNPSFNPCGVPDLWYPNMCPVSGNPLDEEELTHLSSEAREYVQSYLRFFREYVPGFQNAVLTQTAYSLGIRESRRFHGRNTLTKDMVLGAKKQMDAVGHGVWMIDIHDPKGSGYTTHSDQSQSNMVPQGESYHIPLGMCLNDHIPNLAVAGRCASSSHGAHASVRVMSHCMVMGQGLGTAIAIAQQDDCGVDEIDIRKLQATLKANGVYLEEVTVPA